MPIIEFLKTSNDTYTEVSADNPFPTTSTISGGTVTADTELPAAVLLADSKAIPTTPIVGTSPMLYNGATLDFERNNTQGTLLASAARTSTTSGSNQTNYNARGVTIYLNITVASGTGGLTVRIRSVDPVSSGIVVHFSASAAITATGLFAYELYPGAGTAPGTGAGFVNLRGSGPLPRTWFVEILHGDASSYTYSVGHSIIV